MFETGSFSYEKRPVLKPLARVLRVDGNALALRKSVRTPETDVTETQLSARNSIETSFLKSIEIG